MLDVLDASAIRRWSAAAATAMTRQREAIDDLNVFPVPDGDTGTNLALTLRSAAAAVGDEGSAEASAVIKAMARGAVLGARGNSGVILAQILRGMADVVSGPDAIDSDSLKQALAHGAELAYSAVSRPVEGTMLSVVRAAADAGNRADASVAAVLAAAMLAAHTALERTMSQLEVLERAGVVDAGGCGLIVLLDALQSVVTGAAPVNAFGRSDARGVVRAVERADAQFGYEVQYLLHAGADAVDSLKPVLAALGDSLVIVGTGAPDAGEQVWNVHVHVDDVGAAIEAGVEAGRPHRITVRRFADDRAAGAPRPGVAIVAVAPGAGIAEVFRAEGVYVVDGGPTGNPSAAEILAAIRSTAAGSVVLLPNATPVGAVADLAAAQARDEGIAVAVIPTRSPLQGLAAVAVHDPTRRFEDNVISLAETAAATRWAEIAVVEQEALTIVGRCHPGDVLGLIGGEVVTIGARVEAVAQRVIDLLLGVGGELVTVVLGAEAPMQIESALARHLSATAPHAEALFYHGGQSLHVLLIGVE